MRFSVVIPTYNYARYLREALESVLSQSVQPSEIIVADDGSTDGTPSVMEGYANRVRYLRFPHRGIGATRNDLLGEIGEEWFFNLDADDILPPSFFEKACRQLERAAPSVAAAYCDALTFGKFRRRFTSPPFSVPLIKAGNYISMNSFIRTAPARETGFNRDFDDGWEDYEFFLSLVEKGYTAIKLEDVHYLYRVHGESRTSATEDWNTCHRLMERIIAYHPGFFSEEERKAALAKFTPDGAVRLKFSKLLWAHDYIGAIQLLCRHPGPFFRKLRDVARAAKVAVNSE